MAGFAAMLSFVFMVLFDRSGSEMFPLQPSHFFIAFFILKSYSLGNVISLVRRIAHFISPYRTEQKN